MASFGSFLGTALGTDPGAFNRGTTQQIALQKMQRDEQARLNLQKYGGNQQDLNVELRDQVGLDPSGYGSDQIQIPKENTTAADYRRAYEVGVATLNEQKAARIAAEAGEGGGAKVGSSDTPGIGFSDTQGITQVDTEAGTPFEQWYQGGQANFNFDSFMTFMLLKATGGYKGQPGSGLINQGYGFFTDSPKGVTARNNAEEATAYFKTKKAVSYFENNLDQINAAADDPVGWYIKNKDKINKAETGETTAKAGVITKDQADALSNIGEGVLEDVLEAQSTNTSNKALADENVSSLKVVGDTTQISANDNNIGSGDVAKKGEVNSPAVYIENPSQAGFDMERAQKTREEAVKAFNIVNRQVADYQRTAEIYRISGVRAKYDEYKNLAEQAYGNVIAARDVVTNLDNSMVYLQGMQGLNDLQFGNNTNRLSQVWSLYSGRKVRIVPRDDGLFNIMMDGETVVEGMNQRDVSHVAQLQFNSSYKTKMAEEAGEQSTKLFDQKLTFELEARKMFNLIDINKVNNKAAQQLEIIKQMKAEIKSLGDGTALLQMGTEVYLYNPMTEYTEINEKNKKKKKYAPGFTLLNRAEALGLLGASGGNAYADGDVIREVLDNQGSGK